MDTNRGVDQKVLGGVVVLVVAIALLVVAVQNNDKEEANSACALSAAGVTAIALGLSHGNSADAIATASGPLSAVACKELVKSLIDEPSTPRTAVVQLGNRTNRKVDLRATDFVTPSQSKLKTCLDWLTPTFRNACLNRQLSPPPF